MKTKLNELNFYFLVESVINLLFKSEVDGVVGVVVNNRRKNTRILTPKKESEKRHFPLSFVLNRMYTQKLNKNDI